MKEDRIIYSILLLINNYWDQTGEPSNFKSY